MTNQSSVHGRYHQSRVRQFTNDSLRLDDPAQFETVKLGLRYMKFANTTFGWGGLVTLGLIDKDQVGSNALAATLSQIKRTY